MFIVNNSCLYYNIIKGTGENLVFAKEITFPKESTWDLQSKTTKHHGSQQG